ncbi:MAG: M3 family oligoendopeptidase [Anaerolineaceae bacterium]|nr:M3 family oligoendopeptidase [Anaerolineaceae bacterium]
MTTDIIPHWDLSNVYQGLDAEEFKNDLLKMESMIAELETFFKEQIADKDASADPKVLAGLLSELVNRENVMSRMGRTIYAYINSFVSTDSYNKAALRIQSEFSQKMVRYNQISTQIEMWIGKLADVLPQVLEVDGAAKEHAFILMETADQSKYLMSEEKEALSAELSLSSTTAWSKLQGTVTSQLTVDFELNGEVKKLPMPALINLHSHSNADVRKRAYDAEMKAWDSVKEPLAACMNGIKGTVNTLNKHRNREDALHSAIDYARIDRSTLEAMLEAMHDSFPMFRKYFRAKAQRFGKEQLAWWDVFAPVGSSNKEYSFAETQQFVVENFRKFTPELADFAQNAFEKNWIDAEQREGKRGGAFCMGVPGVKESRILCNFDGSLDQVFTIAHELGHGFHNYCYYQANKTMLQTQTPMTMAETASIMCETIVTDAALAQAANDDEKLSILETALIGDSQVIVDIYSRYLFEKEVFERRQKADLSAEELCEIMEDAQKATYGDGLDPNALHKYMWTWKPHYYSAGLSFYNFPYAFGLLFGLGLYAIYQKRGADFVPDYKNLLASTGEASAADLADRFGINIREKKFWADSIAQIGKRVDLYLSL